MQYRLDDAGRILLGHKFASVQRREAAFNPLPFGLMTKYAGIVIDLTPFCLLIITVLLAGNRNLLFFGL